MRHINISLGALVIIVILLTAFQPPAAITQAAGLPQSTPEPKRPLAEAALREAFSATLHGRTDVLAFIINEVEVERIEFSEQGDIALLFLQMRDSQTGEVIATEPGLAIARLAATGDGSKALDWKINLQADQDWEAQLTNLPPGMLTEEGRFLYIRSATPETEPMAATLRGYKLPWAAGQTKQLSGSIGHYLVYNPPSCPETACRYAYDFADGTMFPLLAARGGIVYMLKDNCPNGDTECSNYIVLQDRSTTPWTYQLYLHTAFDSIPNNFVPGVTSIVQGQYIALVDDTGYSTAHHLHFHVHTNASGYWGNSVDIAFDEVTFNDGEPRTCNEAQIRPDLGTGCANSYTSQNQGANPPTGSMSLPNKGEVFTTSTVPVAGVATDDMSITKVQAVVNFGSGWVEVGSTFTTAAFNGTVDLCSANAPDGPLQIGYYAYDYEGNRSVNVLGERQIFKSATCATPAPPPCVPTSNQVALFTDVDYKGSCRVFNIGNYTELNGTMPTWLANKADSILVGSNVTVTGYDGDYDSTYDKFAGRGETYYTSDSNLADNKLTSNKITAIRVLSKSILNDPIIDLFGPDYSRYPTSVESVILSAMTGDQYQNADGANTFYGTLLGPGGTRNLPEQKYPVWSVGNLAVGSYTFTAYAKSGSLLRNGSTTFTVSNGTLAATSNRGVPYFDEMESGPNDWLATGLWRQYTTQGDSGTTTAWGFNNGANYNSEPILAGDLTSPPITLPAGGAYLRFDYLVQTESPNPIWDQRRVQISVNGGQFTDLLQLGDDPVNYWLHSPVINLTGTAYRGNTVRIRFHFNTIDPVANSLMPGWLVDNVSLTTTAPDLSCAEGTSNDTSSTATSISIGSSKNGVICTGGDLDFYKFTATAGQRLIVSVDAASIGSSLDSVLKLVDTNGINVLVENDDATPETQDSRLSYIIQRNGTYYLRVSSWDHPSGGSPQHTYTLNLVQDNVQPVLNLYYPTSQWVSGPTFPVIADLTDPGGSGAGRVDVYFHSSDWQNGLWEKVATDDNPSDGFYIPVDLSAKSPIGGTLLVQGFDLVGRSAIAMVSSINFDNTPPTASFSPLAPVNSNLLKVQWTLDDTPSGLAGFTIQYQVDGGSWVDWLSTPALDLRQEWFMGDLGRTYGFRLQAVDLAGNLRSYPAAAEVSTTIPNCSADLYENGDDAFNSAPLLNLDSPQLHNFCGSGDTDWSKLVRTDDQPLLFTVASGAQMAAYKIGLYAADGQTLLMEVLSAGAGNPAGLPIAPPPGGGTYYLKIQPQVNGLAGDAQSYTITLVTALRIHLPIIGR